MLIDRNSVDLHLKDVDIIIALKD